MKLFTLVLSGILFTTLAWTEESKKFRFPGGDADIGKETFVELKCHQCHKVQGVEIEKPGQDRELTLTLGNEIRFVKDYSTLITAITNPQHVVNKQYAGFLSQLEPGGEITAYMPNLTENMGVRQLMDLVAFLDRVYRDNLDTYDR